MSPFFIFNLTKTKTVIIMKNVKSFLRFLTLAFLTVIVLTACTPQPKDLTEQMKTYETAWKEAYNNGDAHTLALCYTADAKLYPDNSDVIEGRDAIEGFWKIAFTMGMAKAEPTTISATAVGNTAIHIGEYKSFTKDGQMIDRGKYLLTRQKEEGDWKIDKHMWNSSMPAPVARAVENDSVWIVINPVKADKVKQFEDYNFNYLLPTATEGYQAIKNSVRLLKPLEPDEKGIYNYVYLMDPVLGTYDMLPALEAKYGKEKAGEYLKMFQDCLVNGEQELYSTVQTSW